MKVSEVANLTGITVRTLHYYDQIGLLKPSQVSEMARATTSQGSIAPLLPFMDEEDVEKLLEQYESEGRSTSIFYPFLSDKKIRELFERYRAEGKSISALLPFLDDDTLTSLAEEAFCSGGSAALSVYLPFLKQAQVKDFAERILRQE